MSLICRFQIRWHNLASRYSYAQNCHTAFLMHFKQRNRLEKFGVTGAQRLCIWWEYDVLLVIRVYSHLIMPLLIKSNKQITFINLRRVTTFGCHLYDHRVQLNQNQLISWNLPEKHYVNMCRVTISCKSLMNKSVWHCPAHASTRCLLMHRHEAT
jgi:hypothetical protein